MWAKVKREVLKNMIILVIFKVLYAENFLIDKLNNVTREDWIAYVKHRRTTRRKFCNANKVR